MNKDCIQLDVAICFVSKSEKLLIFVIGKIKIAGSWEAQNGDVGL
jgi:hypothetical protein